MPLSACFQEMKRVKDATFGGGGLIVLSMLRRSLRSLGKPAKRHVGILLVSRRCDRNETRPFRAEEGTTCQKEND